MATRDTALVISDDSDDGYESQSFGLLEANDMSIPKTLIQLKGIERRARAFDRASGGSSLVQCHYSKQSLKPSPMSSDGSPSSRKMGTSRPHQVNSTQAGLLSLPSELLARVCENLEPIWVYNLSHTSSRMFRELNGPRANLVWYNVLPSILWGKGEKFQVEGELRDWMVESIKAKSAPVIKKCKKIDADDEVHLIPMTPTNKLTKTKIPSTSKTKRSKRPSPAKINTANAQAWSHDAPGTSVPNTAALQFRYGPYRSSVEEVDPAEREMYETALRANDDRMDVDLTSPSDRENLPRNELEDSLVRLNHSSLLDSPPPAPVRESPPHAPYVERMLQPAPEASTSSTERNRERHWPAAKRQRTSNKQGTDGHLPLSVFELPERKKVKALGGPYQAIFNYKREIMGRLKPKKRCFVCLEYECFLKQIPVDNTQWGMHWCDKCLLENTVSLRALEYLIRDLQRDVRLPNHIVKYPYTTHKRKCLQLGVVRLFRAETDPFFASLGYLSTDFAIKSRERLRITVLQAPDRRLKADTLEMRRRYRKLVVEAAQKIWEGIDPSPEQDVSGVYVPRPRFHPSIYENFRRRFAPTHKLAEFLFPAYLLPEGMLPKLAPGELPKAGYLPDPYQNLVMRSFRPTQRTIADAAEEMLIRLTDYRCIHYDRPGWGGFCAAWTEAADSWHINRITAAQLTGSTIHDWLPYTNGQRQMRLSLSQKLDFTDLAPLVDLVALTEPVLTKDLHTSIGTGVRRDTLIAEEKHLKQTELDRQTKIAAFHKISMETCKRCPHTKLLLPAKGIKALLAHMRGGHRTQYWTTDDFGIIG